MNYSLKDEINELKQVRILAENVKYHLMILRKI